LLNPSTHFGSYLVAVVTFLFALRFAEAECLVVMIVEQLVELWLFEQPIVGQQLVATAAPAINRLSSTGVILVRYEAIKAVRECSLFVRSHQFELQ